MPYTLAAGFVLLASGATPHVSTSFGAVLRHIRALFS
jgi:hypothetical protein